MKRIFVAMAVALLVLGSVSLCPAAKEGFYCPRLKYSDTITIGNYIIQVHARTALDLSLLTKGITGEESSDEVQERIDVNRQQLWPKREIAVVVTDNGTHAAIAGTLYIYQEIYWWNNVNAYLSYWYARYNANVATLFTRVKNGSYRIARYMNGAWANVVVLPTGYTRAHWIAGTTALKGFRGTGLASYNRADVVMFFFR